MSHDRPAFTVGSLVRSLEPEELLRALAAVVGALLREAAEVADDAKVAPHLRELTGECGR